MASKHSKKTNHTEESVGLKLVESENAQLDVSLKRPPLASGDLGKVQELLFGQQLQTTTRQIEELKAHFDKKIADVSAQLLTHVSQLKDLSDDNYQSLSAELQSGKKSHQLELVRVEGVLNTTQSALEKRITTVDNRLDKTDASQKNDLQVAKNQWTESLEKTQRKLMDQLDQTRKSLQEGKVDRQALSGLLGTIATQLTNADEASDSNSNESNNANGSR